MSNPTVFRCPSCKTKCSKVQGDKMEAPSHCVLVESNSAVKSIVKSELDEKIRAWGNAVPPAYLLSSRYNLSLITLEKAKFLKKGSFYLAKKQETIPLEVCNKEESICDEDAACETTTDDDMC